MNACMHDYAKEHRKHGEVKSNMMESRVNTSQGKNYGFTSICNQVHQLNTTIHGNSYTFYNFYSQFKDLISQTTKL